MGTHRRVTMEFQNTPAPRRGEMNTYSRNQGVGRQKHHRHHPQHLHPARGTGAGCGWRGPRTQRALYRYGTKGRIHVAALAGRVGNARIQAICAGSVMLCTPSTTRLHHATRHDIREITTYTNAQELQASGGAQLPRLRSTQQSCRLNRIRYGTQPATLSRSSEGVAPAIRGEMGGADKIMAKGKQLHDQASTGRPRDCNKWSTPNPTHTRPRICCGCLRADRVPEGSPACATDS